MTRTIRFFATNRDREQLGQRFDRNQRIKLQSSGYHWVDTHICMGHYLATTNPNTIPVDAVISPSTERVFDKFLAKPEIRKVVIGIHGFNVPLHGAITSFSLLAEALAATLEARGLSLVLDPEPAATTTGVSPPPAAAAPGRAVQKDQIAFVGFSWPSDGRLLAYQSDRLEAAQSANALANLIANIRAANDSVEVDVIAHSMGSYLVCSMLKSLVDRSAWPYRAWENNAIGRSIAQRLKRRDDAGSSSFIDRLILLAPDVERREVTQCHNININSELLDYNGPFHDGLKHLVGHTYLFYSRNDSALKASMPARCRSPNCPSSLRSWRNWCS